MNDSMLLLVAAGVGVWYFLMGPGKSSTSASSSVSAPTVSSGPAPPPGAPTYTYTPNVTVGTAKYATTYQIMTTDAGTLTFTPDNWGYWLKKALLAQGVIPASGNDPMNPYPWSPPGCAQVGLDCGTPITLDQYMAAAVPFLKSAGIAANWGGGVLTTSQGPVWVSSSASLAGLWDV